MRNNWILPLAIGIGVVILMSRANAKASQPSIPPPPPYVPPPPDETTKLPILSPVFCAADVRECPDGSWVGRKPPSCEFAECPPYIPPPSPPTIDETVPETVPERLPVSPPTIPVPPPPPPSFPSCYKGNTIFGKGQGHDYDIPWEYGYVTYYNHPDYGTVKISNPDLQTVKDAMYDYGWGGFTPKYPC